jgi:lipopolysaccharide transport system permease protein
MNDKSQQWLAVVEPKRKLLSMNLKEVWKYRDLIKLFVRRTFVAHYKQTILGPAWAIIQPFLTTVVYALFFGNVAGLGAAGVPNFIFYLSGTIMWTLFASCLTQSANAFIGNSAILGKVYFPRLVMPIASSLSQLIAFGIQFLFMIGFLIYYIIAQGSVAPNIFMLMLPLLVLQVCVLGLGFGTIIASLTTKYRDLTMLVAFGVELWKFASPVAYDMFGMNVLTDKFYSLYMLNPVTPVINVFRYAFLGCGNIDWMFYGISWITTLLVLLLGILSFGRVEKTFMDTI